MEEIKEAESGRITMWTSGCTIEYNVDDSASDFRKCLVIYVREPRHPTYDVLQQYPVVTDTVHFTDTYPLCRKPFGINVKQIEAYHSVKRLAETTVTFRHK